MRIREIQERLKKLEHKLLPRDKPFMVVLNYDEPFPKDHAGTIYVRRPHPDTRQATIDHPLTIDDLIDP